MHCKTCSAPSFTDPCARCRSLPKVEVVVAPPDPVARPKLPSLMTRAEFKRVFDLVEKLRGHNKDRAEWQELENEIDQLAYACLRYVEALEKSDARLKLVLPESAQVESPASAYEQLEALRQLEKDEAVNPPQVEVVLPPVDQA